jgi:hypothetical protein
MGATGKHRASGRTISTLAAIGLVAGMLVAGPGVAAAAGRSVTLQVRPVIVGEATDCDLFGFDFELFSVQGGTLVGEAHACANDLVEHGGHLYRVSFSGPIDLYLPDGTVSGLAQGRQVWVPDGAEPEIIERFSADLTRGTGAYANMTGSMTGGGRVQWDGDAPVIETLWTITLRRS